MTEITVPARVLIDAADHAAPDRSSDQLDDLVTLQLLPEHIARDGTHMPAGWYLHFAEAPDDGVLGPLGEGAA